MREVIINNQTVPLQSKLLAGYCNSFLCRLRGLMFRKSIPNDWGLLFVQSSESIVNSAIHMIGVSFDIGVIWMDAQGVVVDRSVLKKWVGIKSPQKPAKFYLEVTPSRLEEFNIGDKIKFIDYES